MNRKFLRLISTLTFGLGFFAPLAASAQGVADNRTDSAVAAAATGTAQPVAVPEHQAGGEANLVIPDLSQVTFLGGIRGHSLLMGGLGVCALAWRSGRWCNGSSRPSLSMERLGRSPRQSTGRGSRI